MNSNFVRHLPLSTLLILFPLLIFSYHPVISLGMAFGVHIDISFLYGALLITFIANLLALWRQRSILANSLSWKLSAAFLGFIWISCLWSPNSFRAIATASFFTLVFGIFSAVIIHSPTLLKQKNLLIRLTSYSIVLAIVVALLQIIADALHLPSTFSLLPTMYNGDIFGIARPTAFALEPQFFGSLLLVPFLYSSYRLITKMSRLNLLLFTASTAALLLTLSRGALLAAVVGLVVLLILLRPAKKITFTLLLAGITSIIITFAAIVAVGSIRQDSISGYTAANNVINQLSLGTLSLPEEKPSMNNQPIEASVPSSDASNSGYIESSTDSRLSMSKEALHLWHSSVSTLFFGVGIGGFGASLHATNESAPISSVVNNFYLELLVETGIIGIVLFLSFLGALSYTGLKNRQYLLASLLAAFIVQWCFFSGIANVTHLWIVFGLIAASGIRPLKSKRIKRSI